MEDLFIKWENTISAINKNTLNPQDLISANLVINELKNSPLCWLFCISTAKKCISLITNENKILLFNCLSLLQENIRVKWGIYELNEKKEIKEFIVIYIQSCSESIPRLVIESVSSVMVEIIKLEWPQNWKDMHLELSETSKIGITQLKIVTKIWKRLLEDVDNSEKLSTRMADIRRAICRISNNIITFFKGQITDYLILSFRNDNFYVVMNDTFDVLALLMPIAEFHYFTNQDWFVNLCFSVYEHSMTENKIQLCNQALNCLNIYVQSAHKSHLKQIIENLFFSTKMCDFFVHFMSFSQQFNEQISSTVELVIRLFHAFPSTTFANAVTYGIRDVQKKELIRKFITLSLESLPVLYSSECKYLCTIIFTFWIPLVRNGFQKTDVLALMKQAFIIHIDLCKENADCVQFMDDSISKKSLQAKIISFWSSQNSFKDAELFELVFDYLRQVSDTTDEYTWSSMYAFSTHSLKKFSIPISSEQNEYLLNFLLETIKMTDNSFIYYRCMTIAQFIKFIIIQDQDVLIFVSEIFKSFMNFSETNHLKALLSIYNKFAIHYGTILCNDIDNIFNITNQIFKSDKKYLHKRQLLETYYIIGLKFDNYEQIQMVINNIYAMAEDNLSDILQFINNNFIFKYFVSILAEYYNTKNCNVDFFGDEKFCHSIISFIGKLIHFTEIFGIVASVSPKIDSIENLDSTLSGKNLNSKFKFKKLFGQSIRGHQVNIIISPNTDYILKNIEIIFTIKSAITKLWSQEILESLKNSFPVLYDALKCVDWSVDVSEEIEKETLKSNKNFVCMLRDLMTFITIRLGNAVEVLGESFFLIPNLNDLMNDAFLDNLSYMPFRQIDHFIQKFIYKILKSNFSKIYKTDFIEPFLCKFFDQSYQRILNLWYLDLEEFAQVKNQSDSTNFQVDVKYFWSFVHSLLFCLQIVLNSGYYTSLELNTRKSFAKFIIDALYCKNSGVHTTAIDLIDNRFKEILLKLNGDGDFYQEIFKRYILSVVRNAQMDSPKLYRIGAMIYKAFNFHCYDKILFGMSIECENYKVFEKVFNSNRSNLKQQSVAFKMLMEPIVEKTLSQMYKIEIFKNKLPELIITKPQKSSSKLTDRKYLPYLSVTCSVALGALVLYYGNSCLNALTTRRICKKRKTLFNQKLSNFYWQLRDKINISEINEICSMPVLQLVEKLRNSEIDPISVLRAYQYMAIVAHFETNCLVAFDFQAEEKLTVRLEKVEAVGPLQYLPISIKDNFFMKDFDCTVGIPKYVDKILEKNSPIIQCLIDHGAILFCRTNIPQTGLSLHTINPIFGNTTNPLKSRSLQFTPGGSSGGEAALIAFGGSILGLGSDVAGSLRIPAAMCGIYSLKPCAARVGSTDKWIDRKEQKLIVSVSGPMSRNVDGLVLLMKSMLSERMYQLDPYLSPALFRDN
ncbi:hypothetical protein A3Q56_01131, partial [Intoshia linei]